MNGPRVDYFSAIDLGQAHQFTALAVLERTDSPRRPTEYDVRHLERFPPGIPYREIFARVREVFDEETLAGTMLAADQTGVGKPVVDLLRDAEVNAELGVVAVTAGLRSVYESGLQLVPKIELVGTLQVLLQGRRLRVSDRLPEAATLLSELTTFRAAVATSAEAQPEWRVGIHDDLVFAVALAAWLGERHPAQEPALPFVLTTRAHWPRRW